jgi:hypothetical protein
MPINNNDMSAFTLLLCFGLRIRMCIHAKQVGSFNNHWQSDDREQQQRRIGPRKQQAILTATTNLAQTTERTLARGSKKKKKAHSKRMRMKLASKWRN